MVAVRQHELLEALGGGGQHIGPVGAHEGKAALVHIADDDPPGPVQQHALKGAQAGGPRADDEHCVLGLYLGDARRPVAGGQHVAHEQRLPVAHRVRDLVQALVRIGHPHILGLAAVDAATQGPAAVGVGAVVHPAVAAEIALAAEGLHVHRHPVAGLHGGHGGAHLLHHAHHLMAHGDAGHRAGHAAVLDVQVAGADAGQRHLHDGVPLVLQDRLRFFQQLEPAPFHIRICQHDVPFPFLGAVLPRPLRFYIHFSTSVQGRQRRDSGFLPAGRARLPAPQREALRAFLIGGFAAIEGLAGVKDHLSVL